MFEFTCTKTIDELYEKGIKDEDGQLNWYEVLIPNSMNIALFLDIENFEPEKKDDVVARVETLLLDVFNTSYPKNSVETLDLAWGDACKGTKGSLHAKMANDVVFPTMADLKSFVHRDFIPAILREKEPSDPLANCWFQHREFCIQRNVEDRKPQAYFFKEKQGEREKNVRRTTRLQFVWYLIQTKEKGYLPCASLESITHDMLEFKIGPEVGQIQVDTPQSIWLSGPNDEYLTIAHIWERKPIVDTGVYNPRPWRTLWSTKRDKHRPLVPLGDYTDHKGEWKRHLMCALPEQPIVLPARERGSDRSPFMCSHGIPQEHEIVTDENKLDAIHDFCATHPGFGVWFEKGKRWQVHQMKHTDRHGNPMRYKIRLDDRHCLFEGGAHRKGKNKQHDLLFTKNKITFGCFKHVGESRNVPMPPALKECLFPSTTVAFQREVVKPDEAAEKFKKMAQSFGLNDVQSYNKQYCEPFPELIPGTTLQLKAAMGSGKTHQLYAHLRARIPEERSILLVSHRRSFANKHAGDSDGILKCYLDLQDEAQDLNDIERLIASIEQLPKVKRPYVVVVLDEIEELLGHFSCSTSTMNIQRSRAFTVFERLVKNAEVVIALDARLNRRAMRFLSAHRDKKKTRCIVNTRVPDRGKMYVVHRREEFYEQLIRNVKSGKPGVVVTNTKAEALAIANTLRERYHVISKPKTNIVDLLEHAGKHPGVPGLPTLRMLEINSTTMQNPLIQGIVADATTMWPKFDIVIYTPSVSAGIDCNTDYFKWGMIYAVQCSTNVDSLIQQIGRVRKLKTFFLYLVQSFVEYNTLPVTRHEIGVHFREKIASIRRRSEPTMGADIFDAYSVETRLRDNTQSMHGAELGKHFQYEWTVADKPLVSVIMDNISIRNRDRRAYERRLLDSLTEVGFKICDFGDYLIEHKLNKITAAKAAEWKRKIADGKLAEWKDERDELQNLPIPDPHQMEAIREKERRGTLTHRENLFLRRDIIFRAYNVHAFPEPCDRFIELHYCDEGIRHFRNFCLMVVPTVQGEIFWKTRDKHGGDGRINPDMMLPTEQFKWIAALMTAAGFTNGILHTGIVETTGPKMTDTQQQLAHQWTLILDAFGMSGELKRPKGKQGVFIKRVGKLLKSFCGIDFKQLPCSRKRKRGEGQKRYQRFRICRWRRNAMAELAVQRFKMDAPPRQIDIKTNANLATMIKTIRPKFRWTAPPDDSYDPASDSEDDDDSFRFSHREIVQKKRAK